MSSLTDVLTVPTVKAAIEALQRGDRKAWADLFEPTARLFDDGSPRDLGAFTRDAVGHERFTAIERVEQHGLGVVGRFHSERWGAFRTYFRFQLSPNGRPAAGHWPGGLASALHAHRHRHRAGLRAARRVRGGRPGDGR